MSEVKNREPVYAPALFPKTGRLPNAPAAVRANYRRQTAEVELYRQELNAQRGLRGASTCARALHISLFFDGTNNNEPYDTRKAEPPRPTNIARLYHASLELTENAYFRYYIPGVGTPFPEMSEGNLKTSSLGSIHRKREPEYYQRISCERKVLVTGIFPAKLKTTWRRLMNGQQNKVAGRWVVGSFFLLLAGCSAGAPKYLGGDLNAVNHTSAAINYFSVNGYGGGNASPYGYGGGVCCVMLPSKWSPGLKLKVEWETDPDPYAKIKRKPDGFNFDEAALAEHEANYGQHRAIVELPPYEEELCALEVHFLPCHEIKVSTSCWRYPSPNNPIKEPIEMKEPAVCPK